MQYTLAMINNYRWTFKNERYDMVIKYRRGKVGKGEGELRFAGQLGAFST